MRSNHHQSATAEPASTLSTNITATHHDVSMAQPIEHSIADASNSVDQSLLSSMLPHTSFNQGASLLAGRVADADSGDPSQGKDDGSSATSFTSPAEALLNSTRLDPAHDPTSGGDLHDDLFMPGRPSGETLTTLLGHSSDTESESTNGGSTNPSSEHSDTQHARLGSMFSTDITSAGTAPVPVGYNDEGVHTAKTSSSSNTELNRIGNLLGTGGPSGPARCAMQQALKEQDSTNTGHSSGSNSSTNCDDKPKTSDSSKPTDNNSAHNGITTTTGPDGTKTVTDVNSHTITVLHPDGATETWKCDNNGLRQGDKPIETTDPLTIPDPDHQSTVPAGWDDLLRNDVKQMHQPSHDGDTTNVAGTDIPGMVDQSEATVSLVDEKTKLLGGDAGHDGLQDGGGGNGTGLSGTPTGHLSGVTDPGPDSDQAVRSDGPQERSHEAFKHEAPDASSAPQSNGTEESATPVETSALAVAIRLLDSRVESAGERAADQLPDAVASHDSPNQHRPIEPHERIDGVHVTDLHDMGDAFADLIRAAQNPLQSGLGNMHQPAASDVLEHLGLGTDIADHGFGPHAGEDVHAVSLHAGPLATFHEIHIDHHAASVLV